MHMAWRRRRLLATLNGGRPAAGHRLVVIGAGPTGLGAATRACELGFLRHANQLAVLERDGGPGGLAASERDAAGFLWDRGGHVVFSHYAHFTQTMDGAVEAWNERRRSAFACMRGADGELRFIPYPVQSNVHAMHPDDMEASLAGLAAIRERAGPARNFDDWLLAHFGEPLCDAFMRPYNRKVWCVDPTEMNADWVGERVAVPDPAEVARQARERAAGRAADSAWGPNSNFRFPRQGGTGAIWQGVANQLPPQCQRYGHEVVGVNLKDRELAVRDRAGRRYTERYDELVSTMPLDRLLGIVSGSEPPWASGAAPELLRSHVHVVGVGLSGQAPESLRDKSWVYFPDPDCPFYRVTVFSSYADDHVPDPARHWSLMCESAEPGGTADGARWSGPDIVAQTVAALCRYGLIDEGQVISRHHIDMPYGYPVPSLGREAALAAAQPWLESLDVYSRGRFGGWRYEVSNQDHSYMQGVEVADRLLRDVPEETYPDPAKVNAGRGTDRALARPGGPGAELDVVVAHHNEGLGWLRGWEAHSHVYHKGDPATPPLAGLRGWEPLANVGRESHSYAHHIAERYDQLADVTVFVQGNPWEHGRGWAAFLENALALRGQGGQPALLPFARDLHRCAAWPRGMAQEVLSNPRYPGVQPSARYPTFEAFWEGMFGEPHPETFTHFYSACFAVTRSAVHRRSRNFYQTLRDALAGHSNPVEGHYVERMWCAIFDAPTRLGQK